MKNVSAIKPTVLRNEYDRSVPEIFGLVSLVLSQPLPDLFTLTDIDPLVERAIRVLTNEHVNPR